VFSSLLKEAESAAKETPKPAGFKEECFYPPGAEGMPDTAGFPCGNPVAAV
jgi:hypothetical protein